ncbi:LysR substrate-binding domain-containing protein [Pigmentiphaga soli]|uniref:LysR substrate-binding domain-containing protein n=1 Tax=Pigmentiphaga soli TaxID=1007095 RepID=UPI0031E6AD53
MEFDNDASAPAQLPLHELAAFEAAARLGSFARAAEELCVTGSAIGHRVRQLEARLGTALFERRGRRLTLLPDGRRYHERVAASLAALTEAHRVLAATEQTCLRIAAAPALATAWLLPRIERFRRRRPQARFDVAPVSAAEDADGGDCDVLIHYGDKGADDAARVRIFGDDVGAVCAPALLARLGPIRGAEDFLRAPLIRHTLLPWPAWLQSAFGHGGEAAGGYVFDDAASLLEAAAAGLGIALSTRVACERFIAGGRLVYAHPHLARLHDYYARLSEAGMRKPLAREFVEWIAQTDS